MQSKFLGKEYEGFVVIEAYLRDTNKKQYGKDKKPTQHRSYTFVLENKEADISFTLSGNQLRLIDQGKRTIKEMLTSSHGGASKNPEICEIKRQLLKKGYKEQFSND